MRWNLESIPDVVDLRFFAVFDAHLDDVEPPWQGACAQLLQPRIRSAFDQSLLFLIHRIQSADFTAFAAGFHLNKNQ